MKSKRAIGIILAIISFAVGTAVLISKSGVQAVLVGYGVTVLIVAFIVLIVWLIVGNE